jgi:diguanylate cyclase (GGDEF)-like protein
MTMPNQTELTDGPRILVVEDDPDQRELVCESLSGYFRCAEPGRVVGVATGQACLDLDFADFDIILLDYNLPDMPGLSLLDKILARCDLPVIMVTGENVAATAAEAVRRGAQDYVVKLGDYLFSLPVVVEKNIRQYRLKRENARLQSELESRLEEIRVKNQQLEESLKKLQLMATTDHLTGLSNRRAFSDMLERYFNEATRYDFDLSCIMCDLDHYKALNDTLGHQVGDEVLVAAARIIRVNLRVSDTAARYGGDEFVLLLPHTSVKMAIHVADRIRRQLADVTRQNPATAPGVTLSMGVASLKSNHPATADSLVAMADRALYAAKDRGKNCVVTFTDIANIVSPAIPPAKLA